MSGFEVASIMVALPGLVELCIKYGERIRDSLEAYNTASSAVGLQRIVLDILEGNINDILCFFSMVSEQLDPRFREQMEELLRILASTLAFTLSAFPAFDRNGEQKLSTMSKVRYALYDQKKISKACQDLETWHDRFLKRASIHLQFVLYPRHSHQHKTSTSEQLGVPTQDSHAGGSSRRNDPTKGTTPELMERVERIRLCRRKVDGPLLLPLDTDSASKFPPERVDEFSPLWRSTTKPGTMVEYRSYGGADPYSIDLMRSTVRNIAAELRRVDARTMSILECQGFAEDPFQHNLQLHFSAPEGMENPRSLRALLADERNKRLGKKHSITDRIRLAQAVTTAVLYVHSCGLVHKNIRPENILMFEEIFSGGGEEEAEKHRFPYAIGRPFLAGYEGSRSESAASTLADVPDWRRRIYIAPERLAISELRRPWTWKYDVYSLGVVLLEIALWENFVDETGRVGKALKSAPDEMRPKVLMNQTKQVPRILGDKYAGAVIACLKMLDTEEASGVFRDGDGVLIGTAFISQVMSKLEEIVV